MSKNGKTENGTLISSDSWAIVWKDGHGFDLLVPGEMADKEIIPREAMFLVGVFTRMSEEADFINETIAIIGEEIV